MGCGCNKAKHYAKGAVKIAQSVVGVGVADDATIERRRQICRGCEHAEPCANNVAKKCVCKLCGCRLAHKTRLKTEACPAGHWAAAT